MDRLSESVASKISYTQLVKIKQEKNACYLKVIVIDTIFILGTNNYGPYRRDCRRWKRLCTTAMRVLSLQRIPQAFSASASSLN